MGSLDPYVFTLLDTLERETRPIAGHSDPGAIRDVFLFLRELLQSHGN